MQCHEHGFEWFDKSFKKYTPLACSFIPGPGATSVRSIKITTYSSYCNILGENEYYKFIIN